MTRIDLIKRGDAMDALQIVGAWSTKEQRRALSQAYDKLHRVSAVDAVPVVHARWVHEQRYGDSGGWVWRCTACRRESITPIISAMKYCNACGAKMDAKGDEESE